MIKEEEIILVVDRDELFNNEVNQFQGAIFDEKKVSKYLNIVSLNYQPMRRGSTDETGIDLNECAEQNKSYKQPIPYIVITKEDKFYVTERLEGGGESRLHGKLSMGIGGHMNLIDGFNDFKHLLKENTMRELNEELMVEDNHKEINLVMNGLINDDDNEVGKVHIGLLGQINLTKGQDVSIREIEQLKGAWYTLEDLLSDELFPRVEPWGKIVIEAIKNGEMK